jgi:hypothetical protein
VRIVPSEIGTQPQQIVLYAEEEFKKTRGFERVYAVFDRDQHPTYANAISMAEARNGRLRNDEGRPIVFEAIASVPCYELWFLLHFAEVEGPLHRDDAQRRLRGYIAGYRKGQDNIFEITQAALELAIGRAARLKARYSRLPGNDAYTDAHEVVKVLRKLVSA